MSIKEVILIQNVKHVGKIGDCVKVKRGFACNYLIPKKFALPSTKANLEVFKTKRAELEAAAAARQADAKSRAEAFGQLAPIVIKARVATEDKLYGSVGVSDIVNALTEAGCPAKASEVELPDGVIRILGEYTIALALGDEVHATVQIKVESQDD